MIAAGLIAVLLVQAASAPVAEAEVAAVQRAILDAADRGDRATLDRLIADDFVLRYRILVDGRPRWGTTDKEKVLARWTKPAPGALPTLIAAQRVTVHGDAASSFACITDRAGADARTYSEVLDSFAKVGGRWRWVASLEIEVDACPA